LDFEQKIGAIVTDSGLPTIDQSTLRMGQSNNDVSRINQKKVD
jgi:hypothetical protein